MGDKRMTEEEYFRKHYPDYCYGDRLLSPYWDLFQDGVEFGERQSEQKIEGLEKENNKLLDVINNQDVKIADLEKQIEKMKCCGNCKHCKYSESEESYEWCEKHDQIVNIAIKPCYAYEMFDLDKAIKEIKNDWL